jgi:hypothetical protein
MGDERESDMFRGMTQPQRIVIVVLMVAIVGTQAAQVWGPYAMLGYAVALAALLGGGLVVTGAHRRNAHVIPILGLVGVVALGVVAAYAVTTALVG